MANIPIIALLFAQLATNSVVAGANEVRRQQPKVRGGLTESEKALK